jgi:hypothetical protein
MLSCPQKGLQLNDLRFKLQTSLSEPHSSAALYHIYLLTRITRLELRLHVVRLAPITQFSSSGCSPCLSEKKGAFNLDLDSLDPLVHANSILIINSSIKYLPRRKRFYCRLYQTIYLHSNTKSLSPIYSCFSFWPTSRHLDGRPSHLQVCSSSPDVLVN